MFKLALAFSVAHTAFGGRQLQGVEGDIETLRWVAVINDSTDCHKATATIDSLIAGDNKRRALGAGRVMIETLESHLNCFVEFEGSERFASEIGSLSFVDTVQPNEEVVGFYSWGLDRIDEASLPLDKAPYSPPYTGKGVNIYIVDTGTTPTHEDLEGRTFFGADFVNEGAQEDLNGHGTHCSSTAGGWRYGVAPGANLYGVKVLGAGGSGSTSSVIRGVQWAVDHSGAPPAVISLSLGGGVNSALDKAVEDAAKENIVVVAAGNENKDACTVSPARAKKGVITVGATDINDKLAPYSNWGECVDILAPGSKITAACKSGTKAYTTMSGTSMATPHVAGVSALLLEKHSGDISNAIAELLALGVGGKVKDVRGGNKTPNLLLQVPIYTGPPTPPSPKPTSPPTFAEVQLCDSVRCHKFIPSTFGPQVVPGETPLNGEFVKASSSLCEPVERDMFKGKVVLVARGGCLFFDKVKNAKNGGAIATLIYAEKKTKIFAPAYYGPGSVSIPSCMISFGTMETIKGKTITWGSQDVLNGGEEEWEEEETPAPSPAPTSPCNAINNRKKCRGRGEECTWRSKKKVCRASR